MVKFKRTMLLCFGMIVIYLIVGESLAVATPSVERDLPQTAQPGAIINVSLNVDVGSSDYYVIDENIPYGWSVVNASDGGNFNVDPSHVKWVKMGSVSNTMHTYSVQIPTNASGVHTFNGEFNMRGMDHASSIDSDKQIEITSRDFLERGAPISVDQYFNKVSLTKTDTYYLKKIPETITKYDLVTVDSYSFLRDAASGRMTVEFAEEKFELDLAGGIQTNKGIKKIIHNETGTYEMDIPPIYLFKGKVVGSPESEVQFTISNNALLGYIKTNETSYTIDLAGWVKENGTRKALYIAYNNSNKIIQGSPTIVDVERKTDYITNQIEVVNALIEAETGSSTSSTVYVDILAGYDNEFSDNCIPPYTPEFEIDGIIGNVNNAFSAPDIDVIIDVKKYVNYDITSTDSSDIISEFKNKAANDRDAYNCDLAFLFSGKEFSDNRIGLAYSFNGSHDQAYAIAQMVGVPGSTYDGTYFENVILTTHELGHNFGAHHNDVSDNILPLYARAYNWSGDSKFTSMYYKWQGISGLNGMQNEFSSDTSHGDADHDNSLAIFYRRGCVSNFDGPQEYNLYDQDLNCYISIEEVSAAAEDFLDGNLSIEDISIVIDYFLSGDPYC